MSLHNDDCDPEPEERSPRARRSRPEREEEDFNESDEPSADADSATALPRGLFRVPDDWWGFEAVGRVEHPGLCVRFLSGGRSAAFLKGSSSPRSLLRRGVTVVDPSPENRLKNRTAFDPEPRYFRGHRARLLYPQRHLGYLEAEIFQRICQEMAHLFPSE